jgi:hypothetical protein
MSDLEPIAHPTLGQWLVRHTEATITILVRTSGDTRWVEFQGTVVVDRDGDMCLRMEHGSLQKMPAEGYEFARPTVITARAPGQRSKSTSPESGAGATNLADLLAQRQSADREATSDRHEKEQEARRHREEKEASAAWDRAQQAQRAAEDRQLIAKRAAEQGEELERKLAHHVSMAEHDRQRSSDAQEEVRGLMSEILQTLRGSQSYSTPPSYTPGGNPPDNSPSPAPLFASSSSLQYSPVIIPTLSPPDATLSRGTPSGTRRHPHNVSDTTDTSTSSTTTDVLLHHTLDHQRLTFSTHRLEWDDFFGPGEKDLLRRLPEYVVPKDCGVLVEVRVALSLLVVAASAIANDPNAWLAAFAARLSATDRFLTPAQALEVTTLVDVCRVCSSQTVPPSVVAALAELSLLSEKAVGSDAFILVRLGRLARLQSGDADRIRSGRTAIVRACPALPCRLHQHQQQQHQQRDRRSQQSQQRQQQSPQSPASKQTPAQSQSPRPNPPQQQRQQPPTTGNRSTSDF